MQAMSPDDFAMSQVVYGPRLLNRHLAFFQRIIHVVKHLYNETVQAHEAP